MAKENYVVAKIKSYRKNQQKESLSSILGEIKSALQQSKESLKEVKNILK